MSTVASPVRGRESNMPAKIDASFLRKCGIARANVSYMSIYRIYVSNIRREGIAQRISSLTNIHYIAIFTRLSSQLCTVRMVENYVFRKGAKGGRRVLEISADVCVCSEPLSLSLGVARGDGANVAADPRERGTSRRIAIVADRLP